MDGRVEGRRGRGEEGGVYGCLCMRRAWLWDEVGCCGWWSLVRHGESRYSVAHEYHECRPTKK